jgi:chemotaxis-related protein WspD
VNSDSNIVNARIAAGSEAQKISPTEKARHLLDREPPATAQAEWTQFYAAEKKVAPPVKYSLVVFRVGGEWLGLPANIFQEITERSPIHTLPHRKNNVVLGLVRVRGELLICVSLAAILGIESSAETDTENRKVRFIVLNRAGSRFVFPADEVHGIHRLSEDLSPIPSTVAHSAVTYTRGLFSWQNHTTGCLDDQLLFHTLNRSLA